MNFSFNKRFQKVAYRAINKLQLDLKSFVSFVSLWFHIIAKTYLSKSHLFTE